MIVYFTHLLILFPNLDLLTLFHNFLSYASTLPRLTTIAL